MSKISEAGKIKLKENALRSSRMAKERFMAKYESSPKLCQFCNQPIPYIKRANKFCNSSCFAKHSNKKTPRKISLKTFCPICGTQKLNDRKYCTKHKRIGSGVSHLTDRRNIGRVSRELYFLIYPHKCCICGYDKLIQVDHIIPRTEFAAPWESVYIENLAGLCPNHHLEKTHGMLSQCEVIKAMKELDAQQGFAP